MKSFKHDKQHCLNRSFFSQLKHLLISEGVFKINPTVKEDEGCGIVTGLGSVHLSLQRE